jgi:DNA replicative helicase MCM subunit Mcm2 (Cdc46/Mcm family)
VGLNRGRIDEPASCAECHNKGSMELILNRSVYLNKQVIRMQVRNQTGGTGARDQVSRFSLLSEPSFNHCS